MASQYVAGKYTKIQLDDGQTIDVAPGDEIPPNALMQNHALWIKHGFLVHREGKVVGNVPIQSMPARVSTEADRLRGVAGPMPLPGEPIPSLVYPPMRQAKAAQPEKITRAQLETMQRPELIDLGRRAGLKIGQGEKKSNVIDAIMEAQS